MRICSRCKTEKQDAEFTARRGGLSAACAECLREAKREAYHTRPGEKQATIARNKKSELKRKENAAFRNAWSAWRYAKETRRVPPWVKFTRDILPIYKLCRSFGLAYEIDHIIPLRGKLVSGLHVPDNLRITTKLANKLKRDDFDEALLPMYDMLRDFMLSR